MTHDDKPDYVAARERNDWRTMAAIHAANRREVFDDDDAAPSWSGILVIFLLAAILWLAVAWVT